MWNVNYVAKMVIEEGKLGFIWTMWNVNDNGLGGGKVFAVGFYLNYVECKYKHKNKEYNNYS